jgi:glycosyltransferase involved in cell wall biosynthesis
MKITLVSTYTTATPPLNYGGEIYYWHLANELGKRGHDVTLIGAGGSRTPHNGKTYFVQATKDGQIDYSKEDWIVHTYKDILMDSDIVHDCSLDHIVAEKLRHLYLKKEILNTINGHTYYMPRPPFNVVTGSKWWQEDAKKHGLNTEMVYWGVDTEFYTPEGDKEDYLLWIARFHPDKGLDLALDLAEFLGFNLKVAGSLSFADHRTHGKKYLDRIAKIKNVEYVQLPLDSTHQVAKRELMRKAKAFLYPVQYQECFGMVVAEAMACGTPVIATKNGAMPELIDHEVNGFLCESKQDFTKVITERLDFFTEHKRYHNGFDIWEEARQKALQFDVRKSVDGYEKLYERVIKGETWK